LIFESVFIVNDIKDELDPQKMSELTLVEKERVVEV